MINYGYTISDMYSGYVDLSYYGNNKLNVNDILNNNYAITVHPDYIDSILQGIYKENAIRLQKISSVITQND